MGLWGKRRDMVVHEEDPYNAEPPRQVLAQAPCTPLDAFYVRSHGPVPRIDLDTWRLRVDGLVERPAAWSPAQLRDRFEPAEVTATLQCAGNRRAELMAVRDIPGEAPWGPGAISTARWGGVRLRDVLDAAGIGEGAAHVAFAATDVSQRARPAQPFGGSVPLAKALSEEVLLAWEMNGEPLPAVHGAPVRVVVPGWIGARSVKWLHRISVQADPSDNYFQATAYRMLPADTDLDQAGPGAGISLGPVPLNCDFLSPDAGTRCPSGHAEVAGYAFAGYGGGVARVDVSADGGGTWVQAELDPQVSPWSWRMWRVTLELPAGEHELLARAWDFGGATQPESPRSLWNPQGYGNNAWARLRVSCP
ncbi:sulfite oxidase [Actinopolymorpha singaporensis]|uniref:Sulfite dehydrogenase (Cytochrome) subunit SorA apoprotein n=1 Tax=Actinopolymorpha singaporensis TaxID=117157 RepID=A0A1H1MPJ4_9ACTN|nr:sulfite oxidase [Actinopolymorpha singaporensis]SDR88275.1 sulfite dehydrogenase (cytochrome) subunit SorA apoprotein [Actinopolymorpha singaporensis]